MPFSLLFSYFGLWVAWNASVYVASSAWDVVWSVLTILIALGLTVWGFALDWHHVRIVPRHPSVVRSRIQSAYERGTRRVKQRDGSTTQE